MHRASTLTPVQLDDVIEQCAIEAAISLFSSCSVGLDYADVTERAVIPEMALCGVVGFVGRRISGTMLLATSLEPLETSNTCAASARDWMAELSNQLFGRIRNRLLRRGLELIGTPPAVMRGDHLAAMSERAVGHPIVLRDPSGGKVCLWMDYTIGADLPIAMTALTPEEIPSEGTILLFEPGAVKRSD
jgi:CheY-specific phosphatase CheX